jgi:hypothetical protein
MEITIEYLQKQRKEYESAYLEHIGLANANHGAMEAIDKLINEMKSQQVTLEEGRV